MKRIAAGVYLTKGPKPAISFEHDSDVPGGVVCTAIELPINEAQYALSYSCQNFTRHSVRVTMRLDASQDG